jgi:PAS domain S-box-containing protein
MTNMTASAEMAGDDPLAISYPRGGVPLEAIVRTDELSRRPSRPPDYASENNALVALSTALADSPLTILETLADRALEVLQADSAGLSLLQKDEKRFYWAAISGAWRSHTGGGTARDFGPCGEVLDRNAPMLFTHWELRYPYLAAAKPLAEEGLLVPFYVKGKAVGTIWAIIHTGRRKFDTEDLRLLQSLGQFASAAYQAVQSTEDLKIEIAARKKAETDARQWADRLEAKLQCLVDSNIIGIFILDREGRILEANDAFLRLVGHGRDELGAGLLRWIDMTREDWRDAGEGSLVEVRGTGAVQTHEEEFLRKDGTRVPVLLGVAPIGGGMGQSCAFVVDLTERKRAEGVARDSERRFHEIQIELAYANRVAVIGQMSASIAHEVTQPLSAIVTNASTGLRRLARDPPDVNRASEMIRRTIRDASRAADVIRGLRTLFAKGNGPTELMDLNDATREVIALSLSELQRSRVILRSEFAGDLPPVMGHRVQLQQVILNLVRNATEAMSAFDDRPRQLLIRTTRSDSNGGVLLAVQDSGSGIDPANLERVFEAFYTTKPGGMGTGLSICRAIVEAHGGMLWATQGASHGAIFQFTLPPGAEGCRPHEMSHAAAPARQYSRCRPPSTESPRIATPLSERL